MSFGWLSSFRAGSWIALRSFSLRERESVEKRLNVIKVELQRIGEITVLYERQEGEDGAYTVSEKRTGFYVSGGSSLERLLQAYVAQGGNPFDISMFLQPDRIQVEHDARGKKITTSDQPSFGVVFPESADFYTGYTFTGGYLSIRKFPPRRTGERRLPGDGAQPISSRVRFMREWLSQEIRYKRNELEARILKLCDLREQLLKERDILVAQAVGGTLFAQPDRVTERYSQGFSVAQIANVIDAMFFEEDPDDPGRFDFNSVNKVAMADITNLFVDEEEEEFTAL